jgi:hypothetical protein
MNRKGRCSFYSLFCSPCPTDKAKTSVFHTPFIARLILSFGLHAFPAAGDYRYVVYFLRYYFLTPGYFGHGQSTLTGLDCPDDSPLPGCLIPSRWFLPQSRQERKNNLGHKSFFIYT